MFFRIHAFHGPGFLGSSFFRVRVQVLEVAILYCQLLRKKRKKTDKYDHFRIITLETFVRKLGKN